SLPAANTDGGPDDTLEIDTKTPFVVTLKYGDIQFTLKGLPAEEFPAIPAIDDAYTIEFEQATMRRMLRQTLFAVSQDPVRLQYTGILFERADSTFRLVATDGVVRLAVSSTETPAGESFKAIVPSRSAQEFLKILKPDSEAPAVVSFRKAATGNPTLASFEANGITLTTRIIEGNYTNWERIVPNTCEQHATVQSADILGALKRMGILAKDDQQRVKILASESSMFLKAGNASLGDACERIPAQIEGESIEIVMNGRLLADAVSAVGEECRLEFTGKLNPCVVRPASGDGYFYIQSPMQADGRGA
ncbi:MAG: DNA polymerase III subunit beta, partial [Chloroflexi bacterium]|nr:DNA polymerase III subunit beta [Chloroflexota bacterium]